MPERYGTALDFAFVLKRHSTALDIWVANGIVGGPWYRNRLSREVRSATSGRAELALPTLAIAEVPVAELPVEDRLLLWENSQLFKFRVEHEAISKSEDTGDAAHPAAMDPSAGGTLLEKSHWHGFEASGALTLASREGGFRVPQESGTPPVYLNLRQNEWPRLLEHTPIT